MALHTHNSPEEDPEAVRLLVCHMPSFASIYVGCGRLPLFLCHAGA